MTRTALTFVLLVCSSMAMADGVDGATLHSWLLENSKIETGQVAMANGFNAGEANGYIRGIGEILQVSSVYCVPPNGTVGQAVATVDKFLKDHPELWHMPAVALVARSLSEAFPCKKP